MVYSQRNKLRPELQGLDSAVIKALRQSGQEVTATRVKLYARLYEQLGRFDAAEAALRSGIAAGHSSWKDLGESFFATLTILAPNHKCVTVERPIVKE